MIRSGRFDILKQMVLFDVVLDMYLYIFTCAIMRYKMIYNDIHKQEYIYIYMIQYVDTYLHNVYVHLDHQIILQP